MMEKMKGILTIQLFFMTFISFGQLDQTDKIQLIQVNPQDSLARYAYHTEDLNSTDAINAHESIWGLRSVRTVAVQLKAIARDMETFTITLKRPTNQEPYYVIGLYERQTQALNKLMVYRVYTKNWRIEKKEDWETSWTRVKD